MRVRFLLAVSILVAVAVAACGGSDRPKAATSTTPVTTAVAAAASPAPTGPAATPSLLRGDLTVFAAASLTDAFNEMATELKKANPNLNVTYNFGASSALRLQLQQGARADIFASADQIQMEYAKRSGAIAGEERIFAKNKLVVIYPTSNPGKITTIQDLARPGVKLVLTDKAVPIGNYARVALERMSADPQFGADFGQKALANLRSEEPNVRAVVTRVQLGEADAAIVYASDVTPSVTKDVKSILIPDAFNTVATYPIAVTKDAANRAAAQAFLAYVRSAPAQQILKRHGFIIDSETGTAGVPPIAPASVALLSTAYGRSRTRCPRTGVDAEASAPLSGASSDAHNGGGHPHRALSAAA